MPVDGGEETPLLPSVTFFNFAVVGQGIYFIPRADSEGRYYVQFFNFATRKVQSIIQLRRAGTGLSLSPDGRSLLYTQGGQPKSDLMMVQNFQ
jgi:hypothetical protein